MKDFQLMLCFCWLSFIACYRMMAVLVGFDTFSEVDPVHQPWKWGPELG